jgi:signal peptidase II
MALVFAINYGLDRVTKLLALANLQGSGIHSYLGGVFILLFTENDGAFLSLGSLWPVPVKIAVFIIIPLLVCIYGLYYAVFRERGGWKAAVIVTIIAGGIGNLQDRLLNSFKVVDFMNFGIGSLRTGILNVGDMSVTFGVIALAIMLIVEERSASASVGDAGSKAKDGAERKAGGREKTKKR